jgi:TPR repeat protein
LQTFDAPVTMQTGGEAGAVKTIVRELLDRSKEALIRGLDVHLAGKVPSNDEIRLAASDWEYAQANDDALWASESDPHRVRDALSRLRSRPSEAFEESLALALGGSVIAMNTVGECYFWGNGVKRDPSIGESWFRKAYERGSQRALLNYGKALYYRGDFTGAEAVFRRGADQDWTPALCWLASTLWWKPHRPNDEIRRLWEQAVAKGHPTAPWGLGRVLVSGRCGLLAIPRGLRIQFAYLRDTHNTWQDKRRAG